MLQLGMLITGAAMLIQSRNWKDGILCSLICIASIVAVRPSGNTMLEILVFLYLGGRYIERDTIVKLWLVPVVPAVVLPTLYCFMNKDVNNYFIMDSVGRWKFYFNHSNSYGLWFTFGILASIYIFFRRKTQWSCYILLIVAAIFLYVFPNCKTDAVILILAVPILFFSLNLKRVWRVILALLPAFCILFTIICTMVYSLGVIPIDQKIIHDTFSMRFQDAAILLHLCPISLVGQTVPFLGSNQELFGVMRNAISLDNAYVAVTLYYGLVVSAIIIVMFFVRIFQLGKSGEAKKQLQANLLLLSFVMGMMEWPSWYGTIGFPILF